MVNEQKAEVRMIEFKATGKAINKLVSVVEVVKRRIPHLHQVTETGTLKNVEYYEPLEEGLKPVVNEKSISFIRVILCKDPDRVDTTHVGYQTPLPSDTPPQALPLEKLN